MKFPLPYAFARENQLLLEDDGARQTLVLHAASARGAVGEVLRKYLVQAIEAMPPNSWCSASAPPTRRGSRAPRW